MIPENKLFFSIVLFFILLTCCKEPTSESIKVLILSGKNNHEWQKTTPVLLKIYSSHPDFQVSVTESPDTLNYDHFRKFDVLLSNWNNWPGDSVTWETTTMDGLERFINKGGGAVFFHAGASSFYNRENYHRIGIGRWGQNTSHGQQTTGKIIQLDQQHPITKGMNPFFIIDEIWENTDIHPTADTLGFIMAKDPDNGQNINEPAIFCNKIGQGRSFYTILGHNERALFNTGLQTLILRATQWAAGREIDIEIPRELTKRPVEDKNYSWMETDSTFSLLNNKNTVWQYNFNSRFGKPFFHPLYTDRNRLTCLSPNDHPWHLGLWFSWKFINEANYWEYLNDYRSEETGFQSEGTTNITDIKIIKNEDYSCEIQLSIEYFTQKSEPVMKEERKIFVSVPNSSGEYHFDYENLFLPLVDSVILDRTPIPGEPEGKSWGGYGGLAFRFNQDFTNPEFIPPVPNGPYPKTEWFYMGFNSLTGEKVGVLMMQHPEFTTPYTRWHYVNDPNTPFFYFGPAALYDSKIIMKRDDSLQLKYRVCIINGKTDEPDLDSKYRQFINQ